MKRKKAVRTDSLYVEKELETIQKRVAPFMKKSSIFSFVSIPLISFSFINLFILLFQVGITQELAVFTLLITIVGALGAALFKESIHYNKKALKVSMDYIVERISKSETMLEGAKENYLKKVHTQPIHVFTTFNEFLQHEERIKKM
ncbi:hypothetical protein JCM9140_4722 [Halalkalibacter wakoensis JCM 9140]|uniref:Uncharacterized protein n=1 Tax=Halalkalibacter wakoensis JCM 9140 TaxID=1236970 RepID=W4Q916_9BACI|nr:DUF5392 family protein [Halalkalibacter wakoensis]GAE28480.1 hypothetical protein JCM9140_4722 [Halalkalibacter wakoensis JCM 9140]